MFLFLCCRLARYRWDFNSPINWAAGISWVNGRKKRTRFSWTPQIPRVFNQYV